MADPPYQGATLTATSVSWTAGQVPPEWATRQVPVVDPASYRIVREVARGGMGRIAEAVDVRLEREVALKQLLRPGAGQDRFIREALITARLQHPSIVPIYEVGQFATGEPFIAMKLVHGESMREALRQRGGSARLELVSSLLLVAEAVAYAHSQRVIHRDLKPSNVLLGSFGEVVVIDWGLARHLDAADDIPGGTVVGTPAYMPPEQALGRPVDERADVYSLGAMLYEILAGRPSVEGAHADEVFAQLLTRNPPPLETVAPGVSPELASIVRRAMMPRAADRFRDARELAIELRHFVLGLAPPTVRPEPEVYPAIEEAFAVELGTRVAGALGIFCVVASLVASFFALVSLAFYHRWLPSDIVPRFIGVALVGLIFAASRSSWGRRYAEPLSLGLIVVISAAMMLGNLWQANRMDSFNESMAMILLGSASVIPLRPRATLITFSLITVAALMVAPQWGVPPMSVRYLLLASVLLACTVFATVGSRTGHALRRAEFYNRYRLQRANERLARLDRSGG